MSAKAQNKELQDTAASAALKAGGGSSKSKSPLDSDNKLSSASAAQSLKRAQPRDLPSFPSTGIANKEASAGAAASLAFSGHKNFEYWKPEQSRPAGKAATLASESKPPEFWQPEASVAGSKAALLAHKNNTGVNIWQPDPTPEGNSAAGIAMRGKGKDEATIPKSPTPALGDTRRRRAGSTPATHTYPDSTNSASNALKAATKAHAPKSQASGYNDLPGFSQEDAARIHKAATTNMDRAMYTSAPPVAPEVEEKNRQAGLRAAAISMAKNMMAAQERASELHQNDSSESAAKASHGKKASAEVDRREAAMSFLNLQDAAQKLAAERLAKIDDKNEEYRKYYGAFSPNKSRMSLRGRRRSSSDGQLDSGDHARSEKIRSEMSIFNTKLAEVDTKKRQSDRDALLAAAQKNVRNSMKGLDDKVFLETGKASPAMKAQWEASAREKAEKDSKVRMENYGKVHIGGGQYMDQSAIDAIAAAKVQPTLDEVTRKAEAHRALDEQRRQEAEERRRVAEAKAANERERKRDVNQTWQRFKSEEKEKKKEEKDQEEISRIYQATAEEQNRKARAAELKAKRAVVEKDEREKAATTEALWRDLKESERKEKEEEKSKKTQEKRKSRIGSMFASIGLGDKEKKEETKESKGKAPEVVKPKTIKTEAPKQETIVKTEKTESIPVETTSTSAAPAFTDAAVQEAFKKISDNDEIVPLEEGATTETKEETISTETPSKPVDTEDKASEVTNLTAAPPTSSVPKVTKSTAVPSPSPVPVAAKPTATVIPATTTTTIKAENTEKEGSKQSWFKRKFSRSSKEDRPQPGTIGKLNRSQDESSKSKAKDYKISSPIAIGTGAVAATATGAASMDHPGTQDEATSTDADGSTASPAASALPSHMSTVQRTDTDTNHSERDVALAGKEDQPLILSSIPEPPSSKTEKATRSRSTSVSSLTSHASHTPSNSMRGVASAALATGDRLDAEEALRQAEERPGLKQVDTARTSESQDNFVEARDDLHELTPSATEKNEARSISTSSSGPRETKFHEEL